MNNHKDEVVILAVAYKKQIWITESLEKGA